MPVVNRRSGEKRGCMICLYGNSGCGKTMFGSVLMKMVNDRSGKPMLYWPVEQGDSSIPRGIEYMEWQSEKDNTLDECNAFLRAVSSDEYSGGVIDTISTLSGQMLNFSTGFPLCEKGVTRLGFTTREGKEVLNPALQDYGMNETYMKEIVFDMLKMAGSGKVFLLLAHEKSLAMKMQGGIMLDPVVGPSFPGSNLTREIPKLADVTLRMYVVKPQQAGQNGLRRIQTDSDGLYLARDRRNVFPPLDLDVTVQKGGCGSYEEWLKKIVEKAEETWKPLVDAIVEKR